MNTSMELRNDVCRKVLSVLLKPCHIFDIARHDFALHETVADTLVQCRLITAVALVARLDKCFNLFANRIVPPAAMALAVVGALVPKMMQERSPNQSRACRAKDKRYPEIYDASLCFLV